MYLKLQELQPIKKSLLRKFWKTLDFSHIYLKECFCKSPQIIGNLGHGVTVKSGLIETAATDAVHPPQI